jgi:molecular chaperone DnaK
MNVGIDLGTTYSLIARLEADGTPSLLPDHTDPSLVHTPSTVYIGKDCAIVGQLVDTMVEENPDLKTIRFFKRRFGDTKPIFFDDKGNAWYAESIAALVLRKLVYDAETAGRVEGAVITVPAHFNDVQRKAVLAAAGLAELPVLGLLEEPVAAAMHYGISQGAQDQVIMVYDLGGGTFDATVISLDAKGFYVLSKEGLTNLGGKEFDEKIGAMIIERFERAGVTPNLNARTLQQLRRASEEIKFELCMPGKTQARKVVMLGSQSVEVRISRADFEKEIEPLIEETEAVVKKCVQGAGLQLQDLNALLLVGGSSLTPAIGDHIRKLMGSAASRVKFHEPMRAIAYGAAMHTAQLTGRAAELGLPPELRGVTGYNVGVRIIDQRTGRVKIDPLIKKNMPLPARAHKTYYTSHAAQRNIVLDLVQYQSADSEMIALGKLVVGPLPSPKENYPIEVMVENREDGTVQVRAYDPQTKIDLDHTFSRRSDDEFGHLASQRLLVKGTVINNI